MGRSRSRQPLTMAFWHNSQRYGYGRRGPQKMSPWLWPPKLKDKCHQDLDLRQNDIERTPLYQNGLLHAKIRQDYLGYHPDLLSTPLCCIQTKQGNEELSPMTSLYSINNAINHSFIDSGPTTQS